MTKYGKWLKTGYPNWWASILMPVTYWKGHNIIHFAGFKNHVGLYPGPEAVREFAERLKEYKTSKGTIQLPYSKPVPAELISDIARWCYETGNHP